MLRRTRPTESPEGAPTSRIDAEAARRAQSAMIHLLHLLLARDEDDLRLGSVLGDIVKGRVDRYDHPGTTPRLRTGIQLHRASDSFSDQHPAVRRSKQRLRDVYGRLSGVIVDVFYDHVLARTWGRERIEAEIQGSSTSAPTPGA